MDDILFNNPHASEATIFNIEDKLYINEIKIN